MSIHALELQNLVNIANARLDDHEKYKDSASLRVAAFACGRAVGYVMALDKFKSYPNVNALESRAAALGVA